MWRKDIKTTLYIQRNTGTKTTSMEKSLFQPDITIPGDLLYEARLLSAR